MNRDTAWLVIILLLGANAIAALWRYSGLAQDELPGANTVYEQAMQPTEKVTKAEPEKIIPDEFKEINDKAFFRSTAPLDSASGTQHYEYCARYANLQWPTSVNGELNIINLHKALIKVLFDTSSDNIYLTLENNLHTPVFSHGKAEATSISAIPEDTPNAHVYRSRHILSVYLTSDRLLEYEVRIYSNTGTDSPSAETDRHTYVAFDRQRSRVLSTSDVISDTQAVLAQINAEIDHLNRRGANLKQATRIPNFRIERRRLRFIFPIGEISYSSNKETTISLSYKQLHDNLSVYFLDIINNNDNYSISQSSL